MTTIEFMKISIVAAMDEKRGIGKDNKIPWRIKEDLAHLKELTSGQVVILGRKSYESMLWYYEKSGNPMPGRLYIVITRDKSYKPKRDNATIAHSLGIAFDMAKGKHLGGGRRTPARWGSRRHEVFIVGGAQIFDQVIGIADKLYLTIVSDPPAGGFDCDAFFPDYSDFKKIISEKPMQNDKYKFKFLELGR
jgi:dihydrofolate reductase